MIPWARPPDGSRRKIAARGPARASTTKPPTPDPGGLGVRHTITSPGMPGGYLCAYRERAAHDNAMKHERRELAASRPAAAALAQISNCPLKLSENLHRSIQDSCIAKKRRCPLPPIHEPVVALRRAASGHAEISIHGRTVRPAGVSRLRYMVSELYILNVQARRPSRRR
jgi:hypothetical protein